MTVEQLREGFRRLAVRLYDDEITRRQNIDKLEDDVTFLAVSFGSPTP